MSFQLTNLPEPEYLKYFRLLSIAAVKSPLTDNNMLILTFHNDDNLIHSARYSVIYFLPDPAPTVDFYKLKPNPLG